MGLGGSVTLAGCSEQTDEEETPEPSVEDYVELLEHHFGLPDIADGVDLYHTYRNVSDQELSIVTFECDLFVDNERVGTGTNSVYDLGAGIEESDRMYLNGATQLDEITHYTISVILMIDGEEIEEIYEYEEFEYER
jgi:hypothetical protein